MNVLHHIFQQMLFIGGFDLREVAFNSVELRAIGHIEDLCNVQLLEQMFCILGLMNCKIIKE